MNEGSRTEERITEVIVAWLREEGVQAEGCEELVRGMLHPAGAAALGRRWRAWIGTVVLP